MIRQTDAAGRTALVKGQLDRMVGTKAIKNQRDRTQFAQPRRHLINVTVWVLSGSGDNGEPLNTVPEMSCTVGKASTVFFAVEKNICTNR